MQLLGTALLWFAFAFSPPPPHFFVSSFDDPFVSLSSLLAFFTHVCLFLPLVLSLVGSCCGVRLLFCLCLCIVFFVVVVVVVVVVVEIAVHSRPPSLCLSVSVSVSRTAEDQKHWLSFVHSMHMALHTPCNK